MQKAYQADITSFLLKIQEREQQIKRKRIIAGSLLLLASLSICIYCFLDGSYASSSLDHEILNDVEEPKENIHDDIESYDKYSDVTYWDLKGDWYFFNENT